MSDPENSESLIEHQDGRVELSETSQEALKESPLYNHDLAPVRVSERNWTTYNYVALWFSMSACIPTYMMSSGLIASGMNAWQAIFTILLGNVIVLLPILLNSHPGTKYGIPFPVFARAAYGTYGSNVPALMRAVVACGWFGIQAWIGGQALCTMFGAFIPGFSALGGNFAGHGGGEWLSFAVFWLINIAIVYKGMELLKKVESFAAPFVLLMTFALLIWAVNHAHGLGDLLQQKSKFNNPSEFFKVFIPSLTAMIGFWATLSLNMPDFTRFGHSQKEQTIGQVLALPTAMALFSAMGVMITSAAIVIYPDAQLTELWDPVKLIGRFKEPLVVVVSMFTVALATLSVNVAANVVSPANDFANAFPRYISFKTGGLITGLVGILMQPWRLIADPSGYIFLWLQGYSGGLGAIAGVLIADYWLVRKTKLDLSSLYSVGKATWNWQSLLATALGCLLAWIGAFLPALKGLYDYGWFVGFGVAALVYVLLVPKQPSRSSPVEAAK